VEGASRKMENENQAGGGGGKCRKSSIEEPVIRDPIS